MAGLLLLCGFAVPATAETLADALREAYIENPAPRFGAGAVARHRRAGAAGAVRLATADPRHRRLHHRPRGDRRQVPHVVQRRQGDQPRFRRALSGRGAAGGPAADLQRRRDRGQRQPRREPGPLGPGQARGHRADRVPGHRQGLCVGGAGAQRGRLFARQSGAAEPLSRRCPAALQSGRADPYRRRPVAEPGFRRHRRPGPRPERPAGGDRRLRATGRPPPGEPVAGRPLERAADDAGRGAGLLPRHPRSSRPASTSLRPATRSASTRRSCCRTSTSPAS